MCMWGIANIDLRQKEMKWVKIKNFNEVKFNNWEDEHSDVQVDRRESVSACMLPDYINTNHKACQKP